MTTPRILITAGEPAGIGPELVVKLAQSSHSAQLIVAANKSLILDTAKQLGLNITLIDFSLEQATKANKEQTLYIIDHPLESIPIAGQLNPKNSPYVISTLETAAQMALSGAVDAILTGPVHKAVLNEIDNANYFFSGHTEFFANKAGANKVVMMLATEGLRIALVTTHLPLKDVSEAITESALTETLSILDNELTSKFGIAEPNIAVLGLNPHAGESGLLGQEEIETIIPTLENVSPKLSSQLIGPLPADTAFSPKILSEVDAVLAMYHDQGLPVLKYKGFGSAANITLGLPFIRTSVDHGTGLDIAGKNKASLGSFEYALQVTIDLIQSKNQAS